MGRASPRRAGQLDGVVGDVVRALRGAVGVDQGDVREALQPAPAQLGGQGLPGGDQPAQAGQGHLLVPPALRPRPAGREEGRDDFQDGHPVPPPAASEAQGSWATSSG